MAVDRSSSRASKVLVNCRKLVCVDLILVSLENGILGARYTSIGRRFVEPASATTCAVGRNVSLFSLFFGLCAVRNSRAFAGEPKLKSFKTWHK